jgi:cytochrome P450
MRRRRQSNPSTHNVEVIVDRLPPGPPLPVALQTPLLWGDENRYLRACRRRYGATFTIRDAVGGTLVYLSEPADIKAVFTGDPTVFHAGVANSMLAPVMGQRSVLLLDEDEHLQQRKRMLPAFHGDSVRRYGEIIEEVTRDEMTGWPIDREFALHTRFQAITLEVILRAVIGVKDPQRLTELRIALRRLVDLKPVVLLMWLKPQLGRVGPWRRYRQLQERTDRLLHAEIAQHRADPTLSERTDVLSLLMRPTEGEEPMSDADLRDQLVTLLLAGHETTATGLAWAFERLVRHPRALDHLLHSLDADEDEYLDAVVKETLRVRPVIFDVGRRLTSPVRLGGYLLPAGVTVMPAIGLVHLNDRHHPSHATFRPERFIDTKTESYTWIPFGGGIRRCLGAAFATYEMATVIRTVLTELQPRATRRPDEGIRSKHITLIPTRGARVAFTRRETKRPDLRPGDPARASLSA